MKSSVGPVDTSVVVLGIGVVMGIRGIGGTVTDDMTEGVDAAVVAGVLDGVCREEAREATDMGGRLLLGVAETVVA